MASHESAVKRHRQSLKRRARNRAHRSRLRTEVKKARKVLESGDAEAIRGLIPATLSLLDHSAKLGVIHRNAAARTKSRLARAANRAGSRAS
jgi:small subunit ribosomal protein S20